MRKAILGLAAVTMTLPAVTVPTMAYARHDDRPNYSRYYDGNGNYYGPTWRGRDGRMYCRRPNGTTGLIVGGAAGALIGRELDGGRNRTMGTVLGAAVGALIGREVQRGMSDRRCR